MVTDGYKICLPYLIERYFPIERKQCRSIKYILGDHAIVTTCKSRLISLNLLPLM